MNVASTPCFVNCRQCFTKPEVQWFCLLKQSVVTLNEKKFLYIQPIQCRKYFFSLICHKMTLIFCMQALFRDLICKKENQKAKFFKCLTVEFKAKTLWDQDQALKHPFLHFNLTTNRYLVATVGRLKPAKRKFLLAMLHCKTRIPL